MDYTNFTIISSNEEENTIVIRCNFGEKDFIIIEPAQTEWPTNEDMNSFCLDLVRKTKDPSYEHHSPGTPTNEGDL
jgi:hypothetical protein